MADVHITVTVDPVMVAMAQALAAIDAALGLPEDGCNSTQRTLDAVHKLKAEAAKSERRAITFGDIVQSQVIAMRAAVVAAKLEGVDVGMQWIANTLEGPGHLPDLDEARTLGGAQALWDNETAEHEAFRVAHPAPPDEVGLSPEAALQQKQLFTNCRSAVLALPDKQRTAVLLCFHQNMTHKEAGMVMGLSESSVQKYVTAALKALRIGDWHE